MKNLLKKLIDFRYAISLVLFGLGVAFNLNGSSFNSWSLFGVSDMGNGQRIHVETENDLDTWISMPPKEDGTIWGMQRIIRSDEWMVQTPFFMAQVESDNPLVNEDFGESGQNMILAYNSPVKHISVIGKPFNWGALFLSKSRALSWYWCFKIITFILIAFEFGMIITKKNKSLSVVSAFFITFIPAVQWWFMQHLGDIVWFSLLAIVSIHHFFVSKSYSKKIFSALLLAISLIGFTLVIYPAFQVPFAYLIAIFFAGTFTEAIISKRIKKLDWIIMVLTLGLTVLIIGYSLLDSWESIKLTLGTVYPGSRLSTGGEYRISSIITMLLNPFLPFKVPSIQNQVELASSINFLPFFILFLPMIINKKTLKEHWFGLSMVIFSVILWTYSVIGTIPIISKVTLFSFVPSNRSWQALSVIAVFITIWFIAFVHQYHEKEINKKTLILTSLPALITMLYFIVIENQFNEYVARRHMLLVLFVTYSLYLISIYQFKKIFYILLFVGVMLMGATINPIVMGTDLVEQGRLATQIRTIVDNKPNDKWLVDHSMLYNFPQTQGADTINSVRFYPDITLMEVLDPKGNQEFEWNRYSHTRITLTDAETTLSADESPDILKISLNISQMEVLDVRYVLTNRELDLLFGNEFTKIYGPDLDGNYIYQFD